MFNFRGWLRQPTTILGLGTFGGVVCASLAQYFTGNETASAVVGAVVFGSVHLAMPDNSAIASDAQTLAVDFTRNAVKHTINMQTIMADASKVMVDLAEPPKPETAFTAPRTGSIAAALGVFSLFGLFGLAACNMTPAQQADLQQQIAQGVQIGCVVDGVAQPIAAPVLAGLVPSSAGAVGVDTLLVHPAVVNFCKSLGGTATTVPIPTPPAPALTTLPPSVPLPVTPASAPAVAH